MKTRLIFLVILIACISCGTNNKPVSDAQKEKIKGEVKEVVNNMIKGAEEANFDKMIEPLYDSPDFVFYTNGLTFNYQDVLAMKSAFDQVLNQKITIIDEKYTFLDNSSVIYTSDITSAVNYKDGHSTLLEPEALEFIFKKIDSKWKIIHYCDSYVEKTVKCKEPSKELNQVELMKQFLGSWKWDAGKDTTGYYDAKSYGTGLEGNIRFVTNGKTVIEGKQLMGYDKSADKLIQSQMLKGHNIDCYAYYFISNKKYEIIPYSDISNPEKAPWKCDGEFKSPDTFVETTIVKNKPPETVTFTRVK